MIIPCLKVRWLLALAVDSHDPATVIADSGNCGVYRNSDGGAHWSKPAPLASRATAAIVADPVTSGTFYAGSFGIYKNTDGTSRPFLAIRAGANNQVTLSWSSAATNFMLMTTESLSPPVMWQTVTSAVSDNGPPSRSQSRTCSTAPITSTGCRGCNNLSKQPQKESEEV